MTSSTNSVSGWALYLRALLSFSTRRATALQPRARRARCRGAADWNWVTVRSLWCATRQPSQQGGSCWETPQASQKDLTAAYCKAFLVVLEMFASEMHSRTCVRGARSQTPSGGA